MGMKLQENIYQFIVGTILFLLAMSMVFPFLYIISISFTHSSVYVSNELRFWPEKWSIEAYQIIFAGEGFLASLKSSLFLTFVGTPIQIMISCMMAYMLSKQGLPGRKIMLNLVVFTLLFGPGLIPNYLLIRELGLLNTYWAIILPGTANAWTLLVMKSFFQNIPKEVEESAKMDGCSDMGVFFKIVLPLSKAMLAAFTLFAAVGLWNTYFSAIVYITDSFKWPLQVFLQQVVMSANVEEFMGSDFLQSLQVDVPAEVLKMATVVIVTAPIIAAYPFLQKHFAKGVMIGSIKG
jgi:putative aldouronate transport system permease protein